MPPRTQLNLQRKALERGYDPNIDPKITEHYLEDGRHTGRPKEISLETEQKLLQNVRKDRSGREKSSEVLGYEVGISASSALRILHKYGLRNVKPTRKPGLNAVQKAARLAFCLAHRDWTLEQWKDVIWSDETSVILGQRRGTIRLWRDSGEAYERSCIRRRWKGFTEFMFWGCFSYDSKGPCHIWKRETAQERKAADDELKELNRDLEGVMKEEWELSTAMRRANLRNLRGRKPVWKWNAKNGKLVRTAKAGGIDWYRYWKVSILYSILFTSI